MAFVARLNSEGRVVDRQVLSGRGMSPLQLTVMTDEETDTETMEYFSTRTYGAPTVRYVGIEAQEAEESVDSETACTFDSTLSCGASSMDTDLESVLSFSNKVIRGRSEGGGTDSEGETVDCVQSEAETDEETLLKINGCFAKVPRDAIKEDKDMDMVESVASFESATVCQAHGSCHSLDSTSKTYCARGTNIEKDLELELDISDELEGLSSRTYNVDEGTLRRKANSSLESVCSWSDMYAGALQPSQSRSNIVPALNMPLSDSSSTSSSGASTYYRTLNDEKLDHCGQAAYEDWLLRKERQKQQKLLAEKQDRERRDAEAVLRQRLSQERYEEWCRQKERQKKKSSNNAISGASSVDSLKSQSPGDSSSNSSAHSSGSSSGGKGGQSQGQGAVRPPRLQVPSEVTKQRIKEWERNKEQQQLRDRERQRVQQQTKQQREQMRKQMSEAAWQNWMKKVEQRPKPVPLNQGLDTLRGTVSNIYINPVEWVSLIDPNDSRGD